MRVKYYCDLYISRGWQKKKAALKRKLKHKRLFPPFYVVALSQGEQNQVEIFSSLLLRQHVFDHAELFVVGITDGYDNALEYLEQLTKDTFRKTGTADIRRFILERQEEFEKQGGKA